MENLSSESKQSASTSSSNNNRVLGVAAVVLVILIGSLVWMRSKIQQKTVVPPSPVEKPVGAQPTIGGGYQKGVPQKAEVPSTVAGEMKIINDQGVTKKIQFDTSTPVRKAIYDLFQKTLKEMGYALTIYNRTSLTSEFTIPASTASSGSFSSGCTKYGYKWYSDTGKLDVFFLIDKPGEPCDQEKFFVPLLNAVGHAKGEIFDWWTNGLKEITKGEKLNIDDLPIEATQ